MMEMQVVRGTWMGMAWYASAFVKGDGMSGQVMMGARFVGD